MKDGWHLNVLFCRLKMTVVVGSRLQSFLSRWAWWTRKVETTLRNSSRQYAFESLRALDAYIHHISQLVRRRTTAHCIDLVNAGAELHVFEIYSLCVAAPLLRMRLLSRNLHWTSDTH